MTDHGDQNDATTRRTFMEATAGAVALGGVAGMVGAQQNGPQVIILGGRTSAWRGRAPASIEGESNPTLPLVPGQDYEVRWINLDGQPHNFVVLDGEGNALVSTDIISSETATQTVNFTASEDMAEYYCEVHPSSMRGNVRLVEEEQLEPVNQTQLNATEQPPEGQKEAEPGNVSEPIGLANETFLEGNRTQLRQWRRSRLRLFNQTGNGTVRGNLTSAANETTVNATNATTTTQTNQIGGVSASDVRQAASVPGLGALSVLGGALGGIGLLSRRSDDE